MSHKELPLGVGVGDYVYNVIAETSDAGMPARLTFQLFAGQTMKNMMIVVFVYADGCRW